MPRVAETEVSRDEANPVAGGAVSSELIPLLVLRVRMVDLEHREIGQTLQPVGAGVETGAEDDHLIEF